MFEERSLKLDLCAIALLGLVLFLSTSLLSYDPGDRVGELARPFNRFYEQDLLVYPANDGFQNACGWWGAFASDVLFNSLGVGAYYLAFSLGIFDFLLLTRREIDTPVLRLAGWLASLFGLVALIALLLPNWSTGSVVGPGGYLGVLGQEMLESHFAIVGAVILASSILIGGLLLCTDHLLIRMAVSALLYTKASTAKSRHVVQGMATRRKRRRRDAGQRADVASANAVTDDFDEEDESLQDSEEAFSVKVRGKPVTSDEEGAEDEYEEDLDDEFEENYYKEDDEADDEETEELAVESVTPPAEQQTAGGVASPPHFRVKSKFDKQEREEVMHSLDEATHGDANDYKLPNLDLLIETDEHCFDEQVKEVRRKAQILERTFGSFGFSVKVIEIETGPVIAQYEVELESGLRLSKITNLADDLAIALRVPSVRIVAPIPGKNTVGIEVPNEARQVVRLREVIEETNGRANKMKIPLFLGKDVAGNPLSVDLASLPHLLIAGRTGTGKSVCLNAIISSILMTKKPDEVRLLMIDPKMVELSGYGRLPHLMHPVVTDMRKAEAILAWAVDKMEERYALLARAGVRHITSFNQLGDDELQRRMQPEDEQEWEQIPNHLPFIVVIADEIADLMMTAGKEVEQHIIRLAQKSRAVGIHLILATQKPTVDVITGLIKSNLPARISFQVASRTDSRVVLDEMGAERLLGNGDMLFLWPGTSTLVRGQGTYLTDEEIDRVVDEVSTGEPNYVNELVNLKVQDEEPGGPGPLKNRDDLYEAAVDIVVREGRGSVSLLQRSLGVGYGRAARMIDYMAEDGIVGAYAGSQAREVQITVADWEAMQSGGGETTSPPVPAAPAVAKRRSNKIKPESEGPPWEEDDEETAVAVEEVSDDESFDDAEEYAEDEYEEEDEAEKDGDDDERYEAESA
jgi:S-DNA-T family DNA segregation ATPase FtsK/SpoIIIE